MRIQIYDADTHQVVDQYNDDNYTPLSAGERMNLTVGPATVVEVADEVVLVDGEPSVRVRVRMDASTRSDGEAAARYSARLVHPDPDDPGVFKHLGTAGTGPGIISASPDGDTNLPALEIECGQCATLLIEGREGATPGLVPGLVVQCWQCHAFNDPSVLTPV